MGRHFENELRDLKFSLLAMAGQVEEMIDLTRQAIQERSDAERHVLDAIRAARVAGMSWSAIGLFVGTSGEAARQRYRNEVA